MGVDDVSQTIAQNIVVSGSTIAPNTKFYYSYIDTGSCDWTCGEFKTDTNPGGTEFPITAMSGSIKMFTESGGAPVVYTNFRVVNEFSHSCDLGPTPTPSPTPTPTPTLPPGPTPTPVVPTPTPSPTPQPVFSYTGVVSSTNYFDACNDVPEVERTIYTSGPINSGSYAYSDASLTNEFTFFEFLIDNATGIGYEFPPSNF